MPFKAFSDEEVRARLLALAKKMGYTKTADAIGIRTTELSRVLNDHRRGIHPLVLAYLGFTRVTLYVQMNGARDDG